MQLLDFMKLELTVPAVGIDLGTTNSLVAVFENGAPRLIRNKVGGFLTPSVVSFDGEHLYSGETARARMVTHPKETVSAFKRAMGTEITFKLAGQVFTPVTLSSVVLQSLKADAEAELGCPVEDVVISVPAYFNEMQRKAVSQAAVMAGLNPVRLINEPTAAALAYGLQNLEEESTFLVFDLGGGTFDVSILEVFEGVMEVKATAGDAYLGGEDFSRLLEEHLTSQLSLRQRFDGNKAAVRKLAEQVKLMLSEKDTAEVSADQPGLSLSARLSRAGYEEICAPLLKRLRQPLARVLHDARLEPGDLDRVVLVGGATRMPMIRSFVARHLKHFPEAHIDPDQAVALGAAVQAGLVARNEGLQDVVMTDVSSHTLGIEVSRRIGKQHVPGYYLPIIQRNTVIPVSREEVVSPLSQDQNVIEVNVFQGEAPDVSGNVRLGSLSIPLPRARDGQNRPVSVRFTYDASGLLDVDVVSLVDGRNANLLIKNLSGSLTAEEIAKARAEMAKLKVHPRDSEENALFRARLAQCYEMARFEEREAVGDLLAAFDALIASQDLSAIASFRTGYEEVIQRFESAHVF